MPISVSLIEDDHNTRNALGQLLSGAPELKFLGSYPSAEEGLKGIPKEKPDVALVDINLPGMSGIECVTKLKALLPSLQMLMVTTYEQRDLIFASLRAGARGYILKNTPHEELVRAIEQVHAGGAPMSMQVARKVVEFFETVDKPASEVESLSPREKEILALLAKGYLYKEMGDHLGISMGSVNTYLRRIYEKLQVNSRTAATAKFYGRG